MTRNAKKNPKKLRFKSKKSPKAKMGMNKTGKRMTKLKRNPLRPPPVAKSRSREKQKKQHKKQMNRRTRNMEIINRTAKCPETRNTNASKIFHSAQGVGHTGVPKLASPKSQHSNGTTGF